MDFVDKYAKCPYYVEYRNRSIVCESCESSAEVDTHTFGDRSRAMAYFQTLCCGDYRSCTIAKIIEKKYNSEVT